MSFPINILKLVAFLDLLAVGLIVPLLANHVRKLGSNHIHIGLLGSVYAAFQLGSGPLIGSLSDAKGRKYILIVTLLVCSLAYTLIGYTKSVIIILCTRAILGLFKQTQMLTRAMVPDYEKSEETQSEIYGKMAAISGVGITLGPVIGGHLVEDYPEHGFKYVSVIVGLCFLINACLVYKFLPDPEINPPRRKSRHVHNPENSPGLVNNVCQSLKQSFVDLAKVKWSDYWDVFLLKALIGFAMGVYYSNYSLYLRTTYELSPKYIGYIISFQGTIGSLSSFYIGYINDLYYSDEDYSLRNLHVFLILSMALSGFILSYNVYLYILCLIPLAVGNAVGRLATLEMILKRSKGAHRGKLIGASNSVRSLMGVVAPMTAGLMAHYFGISYALYASLSSTLLGLCMCLYIRNKKIKED